VSAFVSAIRVDMSPYYEITPNQEFEDFVEKQLPDTIAANPAKYQEFVDTFGTHYFDSAFFGGFVQQSIELSSNLNLKMSEKDIKGIQKSIYKNLYIHFKTQIVCETIE